MTPALGMAKRVIPSLFDLLTDLEPLHSREVSPPEWDQRELFKASVARDLANLLNTRRSDADIPEAFELTRGSVKAYGMPDYTSAPVDGEAIRRGIERVVRTFEPRLSLVEVTMNPDDPPDSRGVRFRLWFRIAAVLRTDIGAEEVVYDASLPKESRRFQVVIGR